MRIPTGSIVMACALSVALLVAGCDRPGVKEARMGDEVYLLPATAQGPDPFTGSMVTVPTGSGAGSAGPTGPPHTGTADPAATGPPVPGSSPPALPAGLVAVPPRPFRILSGATPGLYGGTARKAGCDVERQIGYLAGNRAKGDAFARAAGVSASGLGGYLRGLTPVVLRADTRVTDHGYRDGEAFGYQAVLQAGTAVLVDNRGLPRVRCACGNPLASPAPTRGGFGARGSAWSGYRPGQVIAVAPAPRAVTSITIVNAETRTWIERRVGHDVRHDQVVPAPSWATAAPGTAPDPADTASPGSAPPYTTPPGPLRSLPGTSPGATGGPPTAAGQTAPGPASGRSTPAPAPDTAGPWSPPNLDPDPEAPGSPDPPYEIGPPDGIGPPGMPDTLGPPDRGGPVPEGTPDAARSSAVPGAADGEVTAHLSGG
ncbi:hypothetical protein SRB17_18990 [Streptomyces sp. RB17]|uniref:DUF6777 domain-containing protein n=1 Tax=Streptomyces sp. RB17 TaxID=2585197 RepID=UPI00130B83E3|nr:DUF6777 domain-containing protein [Streptomyces sp. RB17]MQY33933.1 hypothetical protein [Streptomyces sp. RB17]